MLDPLVTGLLLQGRNPYAIEVNPTYMYVYGIFYHWVVSLPAAWLGPTLILHRAVSDLCLVLSALVLYWGMRVSRVPRAIAAAGALLFLAHIGHNDMGAGGASMGQLFMLLALVLPLAGNFNWASIVANLVLSIVALCTKPYFFLSAPVLMLFLFLYRSKGQGIAAGVLFAALLATTLAWLNARFPLYLTNVFYVNYNYSLVFESYHHLARMLVLYFPLGIGLVAMLAWRFSRWYPGGWRWPARWEWNFLSPGKPLLVRPALSWVDFMLVTFGLIYLLKLGPHAGNLLAYVYELVTPFLIWRCAILAGVEAPERPEPLYGFIATTVLVIGFLALPHLVLHQRDHRPDWDAAKKALAPYHDVLAPGALNDILQAQGSPIYDGSETEFAFLAFPRNPMPIATPYKAHCDEFFAGLRHKVESRQFNAIVLYTGSSPGTLVPRDLVANHYLLLQTLPLRMTWEDLAIQIWVPAP